MRAQIEREIISLLDWSVEPISLTGVKKYLDFKGLRGDLTQRTVVMMLVEEGVIRITEDRKLEKRKWGQPS